MSASRMPFTWSKFERANGVALPPLAKQRLRNAVVHPSDRSWRDARTIGVAKRPGGMPLTLWACLEKITMTRWPDGRAPTGEQVARALCYAAGLPWGGAR